MMNQERQAQGLSPVAKGGVPRSVPHVPNETFYQREDGVNVNLLVGAPEVAAATKETFTVASEGSFDLDEDIKQVDEWLTRMPTE